MTERSWEVDDVVEVLSNLDAAIEEAERKALDSLARYKFEMFGYWASKWVSLNRIEGLKRPNPFRALVKEARAMKEEK